MPIARTEHLDSLLRAAVQADWKNDAAARRRAYAEAVEVYALCTAAQWRRRIAETARTMVAEQHQALA